MRPTRTQAPPTGAAGTLRKVARGTLGLLAAVWVGAVVLTTALGQQPHPPLPPGFRPPPMQPMPGGRPRPPGFPPGHPMPGQMPPGFPPGAPHGRPHPPPHAPPHHEAHEEEHEGGGHHHCPGKGPTDPIFIRDVNIWHGMLMANNERATAGGFLNQLLFRYDNDKNECDPRNEPPPFLAQILNFGVLLYVVGRFGRKPLAEALVRRRDTIMAEIDSATRIREEAEARLAEYEEKFDTIHDKLDAYRAELIAQGEAEKKHLLAEAEERKVRTRRDAEFLIEQERKAARQMLLEESMEAAVIHARKLLTERMTSADRDKMADGYLTTVGKAIGQASQTRALTGGPS